MFATVEIRWFFSQCPLDVTPHFGAEQAPTAELQQRTDWYLMPSNPACGVKVREGRLEMKMLADRLGVHETESFQGHLEAWQKWSFEFPGDDNPTTDRLSACRWIAVKKQRRLQRFSVDDGRVSRVPERPGNGCEFELTELEVQGVTYWTVGFEAVGEATQRSSNLQHVALHVGRRGGMLEAFSNDNSYGYAHWLHHVVTW